MYIYDDKYKEGNKGNQLKFSVGGKWYKADYLGYEGASEYLASEILKHSNIFNYVPYTLTEIVYNDESFNGCVSPDFLLSRPSAEIVTFQDFFQKQLDKPIKKIMEPMSTKERLQWTVDFIEEKTGLRNFGIYLTQILEFDALILNEDRHFNNLAILRTRYDYDLCPLFDNGAAFLSDTRISYPLKPGVMKYMNNVRSKPFSVSFQKQIEACHELYGKQLVIDMDFDLDLIWDNINAVYGNAIAERMKRVLDHTLNLYRDVFLETENLSIEP